MQSKAQLDLFAAVKEAPATEVSHAANVTHRDVGKSGAGEAMSERTRTRAPKPAAPIVAQPPNGLLRVREAAARLGLAKSTLDKMRCEGRGPKFVKVTSKIVGYDPADVDAYLKSRKRSSTSEQCK